jgi:hypothetical protein
VVRDLIPKGRPQGRHDELALRCLPTVRLTIEPEAEQVTVPLLKRLVIRRKEAERSGTAGECIGKALGVDVEPGDDEVRYIRVPLVTEGVDDLPSDLVQLLVLLLAHASEYPGRAAA